MKVFFLVLLVSIVNCILRPSTLRWVPDLTGLYHKKSIRPNLHNIINRPNKIAYQYYDESWTGRKEETFDNGSDYGDGPVVVEPEMYLDSTEGPSQKYSATPKENVQYPNNFWFVFPRAMASKIRELARHYYSMAARASKKSKKVLTKNINPIAYQYYDDSWSRKENLEHKANYDDFNDSDSAGSMKRSKRAISSINNEKEYNGSYASNNHSDSNRSSGEEDTKDNATQKFEGKTGGGIQRTSPGRGSTRQSVTDYLFDNLFEIIEQIIAVKYKEREIAKEYLYEDIDVLEVLIGQDAKQLSKYLLSKNLLQKLDQIMGVQVGTTLLLKEYKEKNIPKKLFYELIQLAFTDNELDQVKFLNALVELNPRLSSLKRTVFGTPLRDEYQTKTKNNSIRRSILEKISDSALKNIISHYITVHFEVSKYVLTDMYNKSKINKEQFNEGLERLKQANSPQTKKTFGNYLQKIINTEVMASVEYGKQLLLKEYKEGIVPKEKFDYEINHPNRVNIHELKMKILKVLIKYELEKLPKDDSTDFNRTLKDMIGLYSGDNQEDRDLNQKMQEELLINRIVRNLLPEQDI